MNTDIILKNLLENRHYFTKVFDKITDDDFTSIEEKAVFTGIKYLYHKYKRPTTIDELRLFFDTTSSIQKDIKKVAIKKLNEIKEKKFSPIDDKLLIDSTEQWVRNVRTERALEEGIKILEGQSKKTLEEWQEEIKDIVQFSLHSSLGHDYFLDAEKRFEEYGKIESERISSGIELIDLAGYGKKKTLLAFLAPSNAGKTTIMASCAVNAALQGKNVAVFTMEDGEIPWAARIDVNLLNMTLDELKEKGLAVKTTFDSVIGNNLGRIKIKEYPTGVPTINSFKVVLQEWHLKEDFIPDIIFVDYIGIMSPVRKASNGYEKGKFVAEELRSLAIETNTSIVSAVQARRDVFKSDTLGMEDTADSIGIPQTLDTMIGLIPGGEEMPDKYFISVLKSRSINKKKLKPTAVFVDFDHQRFYDIDDKRKAKVPKEIKQEFHQMEEFVEQAEKIDPTKINKIIKEENTAIEVTSDDVPMRNQDLLNIFK